MPAAASADDYQGSPLEDLHWACLEARLASVRRVIKKIKRATGGTVAPAVKRAGGAAAVDQTARQQQHGGGGGIQPIDPAEISSPKRFLTAPPAALASAHAAAQALAIWAPRKLDGKNALHFACNPSSLEECSPADTRHIAVIKFLLTQVSHANKSDTLDWQDSSGDTPLIAASRQGLAEAVHLLLAAGAATAVQNNFGDTALHVASRLGHAPTSMLLQHAGGAELARCRNRLGQRPKLSGLPPLPSPARLAAQRAKLAARVSQVSVAPETDGDDGPAGAGAEHGAATAAASAQAGATGEGQPNARAVRAVAAAEQAGATMDIDAESARPQSTTSRMPVDGDGGATGAAELPAAAATSPVASRLETGANHRPFKSVTTDAAAAKATEMESASQPPTVAGGALNAAVPEVAAAASAAAITVPTPAVASTTRLATHVWKGAGLEKAEAAIEAAFRVMAEGVPGESRDAA
eukprot:SAG22_NODE_867_length_6776_cov_2.480455_2_plen_467_part_00